MRFHGAGEEHKEKELFRFVIIRILCGLCAFACPVKRALSFVSPGCDPAVAGLVAGMARLGKLPLGEGVGVPAERSKAAAVPGKTKRE